MKTEVTNFNLDDNNPLIGWLTINREHALNALNPAVVKEIDYIIENLPDALRVLIITGAGDKAFVAGADIKEMSKFTQHDAMEFSAYGHHVLAKLEDLPLVTIACVNGFALGGGLELAMSCDMIFASDNARLGQPEVGLGIIPGFGGTQRLPRIIGKLKAIELVTTGKMISAEEAKSMGLVNDVVPQSNLETHVLSVAHKITKNGSHAVAAAKSVIYSGAHLSLADANQREAQTFALLFGNGEQNEGMAAFLEKRPPNFTKKITK